jgi:hypothetical protein
LAVLRTDLLFNFLMGLLAVIVIFVLKVNPPADPAMAQPGNLVVSAAWPQGSDDVDLWLAGPGDRGIGYSNTPGLIWSLLRDDRGVIEDVTPLNYESAFSRGLPDGSYVVNVRCFACLYAVDVSVDIRLADGGLVWKGVVRLAGNKDERTAIAWSMRDGRVVTGSESFVFRKIRGE